MIFVVPELVCTHVLAREKPQYNFVTDSKNAESNSWYFVNINHFVTLTLMQVTAVLLDHNMQPTEDMAMESR